MQLTLGETLYRLRIERNIEAKKICEGLCDEATLSRSRDDTRAMDILLFESIVGRMAVTSEEFSLMVTKKEYEYHQWKNNVYAAIEDAKWDELSIMLEFDIKETSWINEKLQKQFYHYAKGIYLGTQQEFKAAFEELKFAQEKTILKQTLQDKKMCLNTMELHILMLSLLYGVKGQQLDEENARRMFGYLEEYIYDGLLDIIEKAKVYPKLICIGLHCFDESMTNEEKMRLCEKAIKLLRENKTFHDITELLRLYIPLLEVSESDGVGFYKKQYEVFCDLLQGERIDTGFRPEVLEEPKTKVYLISEYLSSKRQEKGITQEMLSEGICATETYSRVERGERAPSRKNFKALADRLDISWALYRGEIVSDNFKAYELRRLQRRANIEGRREDSLVLIRELESYLDMSVVENHQYVKYQEYITNYRLGRIHIDEVCEKLQELLFLTQNKKIDTSNLVYYSQTEMEIIAHLAQLYEKCNKSEEGILLIETLVKQMENSELNYEDQWNGFCFLFSVLAGLYFSIGNYDIAIRLSKYVKKIIVKRKDGFNLPEVLDEIADNLEHKGKQYSDEYQKLYRYTYYIADFFFIGKITEGAKHYYEENFDANIKWY